jgi:hypothetical protein
MNKIETSNLIEPSIKLNLNSTSNINYIIELDAFTISKDDFFPIEFLNINKLFSFCSYFRR